MRRTLSAFLPGSVFSVGLSEGLPGVAREGAHEGLGVRSVPPPDASVAQTVDDLLAGAAFDAEEVYNKYWRGNWKPEDARASLFGPLKGAALQAAVQQVLAFGQQKLSQQRAELRTLNNLFVSLLDQATTETESLPTVPEAPPSVSTVSPSEPQALDVRRVINALYNLRDDDDPMWVLDLFGGLTGPALLAALQEVRAGLDDPDLNIDGENRERVLAGIDTIRRHVLQAEAATDPDPERGEGTGIPPPLARATPLPPQQARLIVHALLDLEDGADPREVWALFGALEGLDRLRALDQVEEALHKGPLEGSIGDEDLRRISACIEALRRSVEVSPEDESHAALLRGSHPGGLPASTPPDPWALINRLRKGKYSEGDNAALIDLFDGRTGAELWDTLDDMERVLREDARLGECTRLSEDEREAVLACLDGFRKDLQREQNEVDAAIDGLIAEIEQWDLPGDARWTPASSTPPLADALGTLGQLIDQVEASSKLRPRPLTKDRPWFDLRMKAFRRALALGGVQALQRLLAHLSPPRQWQVVSSLVEDPALLNRYPDLLALEQDVYRHRIAHRRGDQPLERVRNWYRLLSTQTRVSPVPPAVPAGIGPEEWVRELRIMLYQRHPEPSRKRTELSRALESYQRALGVKSDREHAEALWLDSVKAALKAADSGHALLEWLCHHLGLDANVALALMAALAEAAAFDEPQQTLIRRAAAILMAKHDHCLLCIAVPYLGPGTPRQLNILYPRAPKASAPADILEHHQKRVDNWHKHAPLVDQDIHTVQAALQTLPVTRTGSDGQNVVLTPGEHCDYLLCVMGLPPKRMGLALLKIAQSCTEPEDREKYLLVRRLLSELVYSERNDAGRNQPMSVIEILLRWLVGVVPNGLREGIAHWLSAFVMQAIAYYGGGWAFPVLGMASVAVSWWAHYHLEHAKSPDYQLNPSPVLDALIQCVPPLNTVCLMGLFLGTSGLSVARGIDLPLRIGLALCVSNLARLLRQIVQSGTQPLAYLFRLVDQRGAGLPAQMTFFVNCGRDALYLGSSIGFLFFLARQLDDMVQQWGPAQSTGDVLLRLLLKTLPSALNETADGMNPDIAILLARLVSWLKGALGLGDDDFLLQPNVRIQLAAIPAHMADHIAGRSTMPGLQDPFLAASALADELRKPELAQLFKALAAVLNGFTGALRGRELSYLRTTDPRASALAPRDGFNPRNPDGLLVALAYLGSAFVSKAQQGLLGLGLRQAPPPRTVTEMPPEVREGQRQRVQTLLLSSRGRDTVPSTPRTKNSSEADSTDDGERIFIDLSGGTPVLPRSPVKSGDDEDDAGPLVDLDISPRDSSSGTSHPPDDSDAH